MTTEQTQTIPNSKPQSRFAFAFAFIWCVLLFICALYTSAKVFSGNGFESNILSLIPDQLIPIESQLVKAQLRKQVEQQFIILLKAESSQSGLLLAKELNKQLQSVPGVVDSSLA